jgi:O6-methylguanine-DNA--protein-cysteine methyltransferase
MLNVYFRTVRVVSVSSDKGSSVQHDGLDSKNLFLNQVVEWLRWYFVDPKNLPDLPPVCLPVDGSTEFERKVWTTLAERTGFGKTISYAGLAAEIDNPSNNLITLYIY